MSREMKDSGVEWISEIPKDWDIIRAKNVFSYHKDIVGEKENEYERLSLTLNGVLKRKRNDSKGLQSESLYTYQILNKDELVFKMIDLENISTSRVGYSKYTGLVSPVYIIFNNSDYARFGYYYFYNMWQRAIFNQLGNNGVRSALNASDMLNLPFPKISKKEANKIANFLDEKVGEIDKLIDNAKKSIEEYTKYKQSIITEAVTKGLDPNVEMKDSGIEWIGEIPKNWEINIINQIFFNLKNKNINLQEQNLLSLSYGRIIRKNIKDNTGLLPENFTGYNIIDKNDIVLRLTDLQNDHKSLRVGRAEERGIITSAYITLRPRKNMDTRYYYRFLHTFDIHKGFYGMGSGVRQGLNFDELKYLKVLTPPIHEQKEISNYLDLKCAEIDNLISKKQQLISELESYKKSLIYEYVTGKKEVL